MSQLADLELRNEEDPERTVRLWADAAEEPPERPSRRGLWILVIVVVLLVAAVAAWFVWRPVPPVAAPEPTVPRVVETRPRLLERTDAEPVDDEPLPELATSDAFVRRLVAGVSSHPRLAEWLVNDGLVQRFAGIVGNIAYDEDPIVHARFLRPGGGFQTRDLDGRTVIDPISYRRYETLVVALESLDEQGTATAFRRLRPLVEDAYAQLGYPDDLDTAMRRTIAKVLEVPRLEAPTVHQEVLAFHYADPDLEALSPAQKALLRTGEQNVARIQAKVRRLADALGLR